MIVNKEIDLKKNLYFEIFSLLNEIANWGVTPSDLKVLSELYLLDFELYMDNKIKSPVNRMSILFSKESKNKIIDKLNISYNTFNNSLSKLRKKGLIESNTINEKRLYNLNKDSFTFTINFKDKLNEDSKKSS